MLAKHHPFFCLVAPQPVDCAFYVLLLKYFSLLMTSYEPPHALVALASVAKWMSTITYTCRSDEQQARAPEWMWVPSTA